MTFHMNRKSALHPVTRALLGLGLAAALTSGPSLAAVDSKAGQYYEDALSRYNKNDLPGAVIQLKNALQIDKAMLSAQLLLGKALMANGEVAAAEVAFTEALRLGVNRSEVVLPLARALIDQGKQKSLFDRPELGLNGLPPTVQMPLHLLRAGAYSDLGNPREAIESVEAGRAIDPKAVDSWITEVSLRIRAKQYREAAVAAEKAVALAPNSAEAWYQKGTVAHTGGDALAALKNYDQSLLITPGHIESRIARAGIYMDLQRFKDAASDVAYVQNYFKEQAEKSELVAERALEEPRAAYLRALLAERESDTETVKASLKTITDLLDPVPIDFIRFRPQLLMLNGLAHFSQGEMGKAKEYLEELSKHGMSPAVKLLAQIYLNQHSPAKAQTLLENYLRTAPKDSRAILLLATAQLSQGRSVRATALMQEALALDDTPEVRTALGQSLLSGGKTDDAVAQLEKALQKDPGQSQAGFLLSGIYLRAGQPRKAVTVAEAVVNRLPNVAAHHNLLGIARGSVGDTAGARAAFERALKLDPGLTPAKLNLARLEIDAKAYDKAEQRLKQMIADNERNVGAHLALAAIAEQRGKAAEVRRALEKARDVEGPKQVKAALMLVDHHMRQRRPAEALEAAKRAFSKASEDFNVLMVYARIRFANNDPTGAALTLKDAARVADFFPERLVAVALLQLQTPDLAGVQYSLEKALSSRPNYLPALALMTEVELRQGEPAKAERRARLILESNPKLAIGHSLLGDIALARGQGAATVDAYRKAHQVEPSSETLLRLFNALSRQGDTRGALLLAEHWLKGKSDDQGVRRALADGYAQAGNYPAAKNLYQELLAKNPGDAVVLNNLANIQIRMRDLVSAVTTARKALEKDTGNAAILDTLGWALFLSKQNESALQYIRDARLRDPSNPEIRYHLGAVLNAFDRKPEASEELEAALSYGANASWVGDARNILQSLK